MRPCLVRECVLCGSLVVNVCPTPLQIRAWGASAGTLALGLSFYGIIIPLLYINVKYFAKVVVIRRLFSRLKWGKYRVVMSLTNYSRVLAIYLRFGYCAMLCHFDSGLCSGSCVVGVGATLCVVGGLFVVVGAVVGVLRGRPGLRLWSDGVSASSRMLQSRPKRSALILPSRIIATTRARDVPSSFAASVVVIAIIHAPCISDSSISDSSISDYTTSYPTMQLLHCNHV